LNIADKGKLSSTSPSQTSKFFIPNEQLEQLKESVDLVSVIGSYGMPQFKRSGDNRATCICPFHDDRNPSLSIDGTRGIFKCFSCGAGGNVFNFVREYSKVEGEEMSFYKAVKLVNDKFSNGFSLTLSDGYSGKWSGSQEERDILAAKRERILQANLAAAAFFENSLTTSSTAGPARSHLRSRGLAAQTVRTFAIGFAPESYFTGKQTGPRRWGDGSLVNHLRDKGFTAAEIVDAGLAIRTKKGRQLTEDDNNSTNTTGKI
jgi:DNA primase